MKIKLFAVAVLVLLIPGFSINAATMVEIDSEDGNSRIYTEGHKGRMEISGGEKMPDSKVFVIVDTKKDNVFVVMPESQTVIDMSNSLKDSVIKTDDQSNKTVFKQVGAGPKIAGYKTIKFDYSTNGNHCGSIFVSKNALVDSGLRHMLGVLRKMATRANSFEQNVMTNSDPCEAADALLTAKIVKIGMPLRVLDADGTLKRLVTKIDKNAKLPPDAFKIPENYKIMKTGQMMQTAQDRIQENTPQFNNIMDQMQKSGNLPPDALEQLKRAKEMMEKYQQGAR